MKREPPPGTTPGERLITALAAWAAADDQLAAATHAFFRAIAQGRAGRGTYDALEAIKRHLAFERYHVPRQVLNAAEETGI
jgi:hypothetical protein